MITKISMLSISSFLPHNHDWNFCIDFKIMIGSHFGLTIMIGKFPLKSWSRSHEVATILPLSLHVTMNPLIMIMFFSNTLWSWSHINISTFSFLNPSFLFRSLFFLFSLSKIETPALHLLSLHLHHSSNLSLKSLNYSIQISLNLFLSRIHCI